MSIFSVRFRSEYFNLSINILGTGQPNSSHSHRDRVTVGNNGAKISAALSDTSHSHQEVMRSSSSSAALVNANNTETSSKYNYYQMHQNIQKSTGTSSITSESVTGMKFTGINLHS